MLPNRQLYRQNKKKKNNTNQNTCLCIQTKRYRYIFDREKKQIIINGLWWIHTARVCVSWQPLHCTADFWCTTDSLVLLLLLLCCVNSTNISFHLEFIRMTAIFFYSFSQRATMLSIVLNAFIGYIDRYKKNKPICIAIRCMCTCIYVHTHKKRKRETEKRIINGYNDNKETATREKNCSQKTHKWYRIEFLIATSSKLVWVRIKWPSIRHDENCIIIYNVRRLLRSYLIRPILIWYG